MHPSRREFLGFAGVGLAGLTLAACSRVGGGDSGGTALTVKHLFGETTIPTAPTRVVSAGLTEADDLLAVGVVPIAVTNWFGDQPSGVWPWAQSRLGDANPEVLNLDNGIQVEKIAALKPDLIIAINAGLDSATYQKLAAIAPTIAQSGGDAFFQPWRDQAETVGKAVGKSEQMTQIVDAAGAKFTAAGQSNPQFKDKSVALLAGRFSGDIITAAAGGWRTDFLTSMGFTIPSTLAGLAGPDHQASIPRSDLAAAVDSADVLIWTTESDAEQSALENDPTVVDIRSRRGDHSVYTTGDLAAAIAYASPLSYPVVAEQLPPLLARVLR